MRLKAWVISNGARIETETEGGVVNEILMWGGAGIQPLAPCGTVQVTPLVYVFQMLVGIRHRATRVDRMVLGGDEPEIKCGMHPRPELQEGAAQMVVMVL